LSVEIGTNTSHDMNINADTEKEMASVVDMDIVHVYDTERK
jgi:hypothetical protein